MNVEWRAVWDVERAVERMLELTGVLTPIVKSQLQTQMQLNTKTQIQNTNTNRDAGTDPVNSQH